VKQFLAILALCVAAASASSFAGQRVGPHVVLERPCREFLDQCSASITINGPITKADANAIRLILDGEARRTGKQIRPSVHISSEGGDVEAAMQIGRDLRRTEGELWLNLGDGVNQAADFFSDATSIPSRNVTPLTTFGN
jgi:hypothetical protein